MTVLGFTDTELAPPEPRSVGPKISAAERLAQRERYAAAETAHLRGDYPRAIELLRQIQAQMALKPSAYTAAQRATVAAALGQAQAAAAGEPAAENAPPADPFAAPRVWPWVVGGITVLALGAWLVNRSR